MTRTRLHAALIALLAIVALSACGGADDPAADTDDEPTAADAGGDEADDPGEATEAADDAGGADVTGFRVAYASDLDPNDMADQLGLQAVDAEVTALTEDSAVAAGLNNGDFDIGNIDVTAAIKAIQGGVPLTIVYPSQNVPEFVMVAQAEYTEIADLEGATVAYHAPGSLTEIVQRELVRQTDPALEDSIDWTVLPESPNRATAMAAGRIDATSLEFLDVLALQEEGEFTVLGSWGDLEGESANALATAWVVSDEALETDRDRIEAFLTAIQEGYDTVYEDKDAWMAVATEQIADIDEERLSEAYDYYTSIEMYPRAGENPITEERWTGLDAFFRQIGEYEQEAPLDMVDLDLVEAVNGG
ncbi:ABC transporter substrate-binding protein [Euzebya sp.]|uniref:ABC transporter substrate-binding protein n=1 Tax=Euzebya sp. TaxID=1971409 RepID=UPI0035147132